MSEYDGQVIHEYAGSPMPVYPLQSPASLLYPASGIWTPGPAQLDVSSEIRLQQYDPNHVALTNGAVYIDTYSRWSDNSPPYQQIQDYQSYATESQVPSLGSATISSTESSPVGYHQASPSLYRSPMPTPPIYMQYESAPVSNAKTASHKRKSSSHGKPAQMSTKQSSSRNRNKSQKTSRQKSRVEDEPVNAEIVVEQDPMAQAGDEEQHKRLQQRNRQAASRFRARKRDDTEKLRVVEEESERQNQQLFQSVTELTQKVYQLKMQLLQHSDCDCSLIQNYIQNEAQRYIHGLHSGQDARRCSMASSEMDMV